MIQETKYRQLFDRNVISPYLNLDLVISQTLHPKATYM